MSNLSSSASPNSPQQFPAAEPDYLTQAKQLLLLSRRHLEILDTAHPGSRTPDPPAGLYDGIDLTPEQKRQLYRGL